MVPTDGSKFSAQIPAQVPIVKIDKIDPNKKTYYRYKQQKKKNNKLEEKRMSKVVHQLKENELKEIEELFEKNRRRINFNSLEKYCL